MIRSPLAQGRPRAVLASLALVVAFAHAPFLATSLEDIDSVNFALGVRDFDVATHRPHPPGYPVYIFLGKISTAIAGAVINASQSVVEATALSALSLLSAVAAIVALYGVFACLSPRRIPAEESPWQTLDVNAVAAAAMTVACPLFWYLSVRPMSDLPGFALAAAAQACLLLAWWRQSPGADNDRRLAPAAMAASGRMIVIGAFLAALSIGLRSQTVWFTAPLLILVVLDRIGRGAAGAMIGSGVTFAAGGLAWGIPLLVASGGLGAYLAALGTQAGEDFASGEMLYTNPSPRAAAFALMRTFISPWDSVPLGSAVLALAAAGVLHLAWKDRRSLIAILAVTTPYAAFHLLFQDTSFIRYALPLVPFTACLAVRGVALVSQRAVPLVAAIVSVAGVAIASPVLAAYGAAPSPAVRAVEAMRAARSVDNPGALAMHQTFVRPLEAEEVGITPQLASPPRLEWLEVVKYWKTGTTRPLWFLADPIRTDLAHFDPASLRDSTEFTWPLVTRPAFGGMRPSAVRWYRMTAPGWLAEDGWSFTPESSGIAWQRGRFPHLGPITAMVRRRDTPARVLIGGRNLADSGSSAARFTLSIDGAVIRQWDAPPGFFLNVFDIPAGALSGSGAFATLAVQSAAAGGSAVVPTGIEQFDLQDPHVTMWGYGEGWQEAEFNTVFGVWRWTSDRATLRIAGPPRALRITLRVESPLRYFEQAPRVRAVAGDREIAAVTLDSDREWTFDVPADAIAASEGALTVETSQTFSPAERGRAADQRRLGLRVFAISVLALDSTVSNGLTAAESPR
ncbi:MAG TPA: DUF2723 domain-containing protein [Vicinamibacterales bacterium]|nr:DUF2723 domain-containing protein [Vicinamibacterales bacterium]